MKTEVIASVTTLINTYENKLAIHREFETLSLVQEVEIKEFIENLTSLLIYVEDVHEEKNSLKLDYETIKTDRDSLKETIENMTIVQKNLQEKIEQLREANTKWRGLRNKLVMTESEGF